MFYVEDNPANLLLVENLIARRPDIRMLSARDGNRGIQALRILAEEPATARIPVIALSAYAIPLKDNEFMDTLDVALKFAKPKIARAHKKDLEQ